MENFTLISIGGNGQCTKIHAENVSLYSTVFEHVGWNPARHFYSDTTLNFIGGVCLRVGGVVEV